MSTLETKEIESTDANPYEDLTCAECGYGGVDNTGLCVMDADHVAVIWTPILPQSDGIYFWRTRVTTKLVERLHGLFYIETSRFGVPDEYMQRQGGEYMGPITANCFERLVLGQRYKKRLANA